MPRPLSTVSQALFEEDGRDGRSRNVRKRRDGFGGQGHREMNSGGLVARILRGEC